MIKLYDEGIYLVNGKEIVKESEAKSFSKEDAKKGTIAYGIMKNHNVSGDMDHLKIKFDAMASHDITYVGIIQTARASGMEKFPLPYVMTCCHNSLCAVGGWWYLCTSSYCRYPPVYARKLCWMRKDDFRF